MNLEMLFADKTKKAKEKTFIISNSLKNKELYIEELIVFAEKSKDSIKAICIEAMEFSTKENKNIGSEIMLDFVTKSLQHKAPRVKWESAKVIANIASQFPDKLEKPVQNLLENIKYEGTVVRWATVLALGEILKLNTKINQKLLPIFQQLSEKEMENGVKKKYLEILKKL